MSAKFEIHKTHEQEAAADDGRIVALLTLYHALSADEKLPVLQATMLPDFKYIDDMSSMYQGLNVVVREKIGSDTAYLHYQDVTVIQSVDQLKGLLKSSEAGFVPGLMKSIQDTQSVTDFWRGNLALFAYSFSGDNKIVGMVMAIANGFASQTTRLGKSKLPAVHFSEKPTKEKIRVALTNAKAGNEMYLNALTALLADQPTDGV